MTIWGPETIEWLAQGQVALKQWCQGLKWGPSLPGPELFLVFTLPPNAECHLVLVQFPNCITWQIEGDFWNGSFKVSRCYHARSVKEFIQQYMYLLNSISGLKNQIKYCPTKCIILKLLGKQSVPSLNMFKGCFKFPTYKKLILETFSLHVWMFVLLKSRRGVLSMWPIVQTNILLGSEMPISESVESTSQKSHHLLWVSIPFSHGRFPGCLLPCHY